MGIAFSVMLMGVLKHVWRGRRVTPFAAVDGMVAAQLRSDRFKVTSKFDAKRVHPCTADQVRNRHDAERALLHGVNHERPVMNAILHLGWPFATVCITFIIACVVIYGIKKGDGQ